MSTSFVSSTAATSIPPLPEFNSIIDDSPSFHQSLKHWTTKSSRIGLTTHEIASCLDEYHSTGTTHQASGNGLSEILNRSAQIFKEDDLLEEPFVKFSDTINRIECYRSMLLTQTEMLGVEPMMEMANEMEKTKKCKNRVMKLAEVMHVSWEKFSAMPHVSNLHDPQQLDRHAHHMITLKQKYQLLLAEYIENIQDVNTQKKVSLLQKVLEHMFAEFSYFNYCAQILKDLEPYMTELFEKLQKKQRECEQVALLNDSFRREIETKIDVEAQTKRKLFPLGDSSTVITNTPSHFFNKVGGFISSGVKDLKKQYNSSSPTKKTEEPDWEVIDEIEKMENVEDHSQFYIPLNKVEVGVEVEVEENGETSTNKAIKPDEENNEEDLQSGNNDVDSKPDTTDGLFRNNKVAPENQPEQLEKDEACGILRSNKVTPINIPARFEKEGACMESMSISKKGYLRIKERGKPKSNYPLLYFLLDKGYGELLSQRQDQKHPCVFAKLQLSNVKPCKPTETDRNFCFVLRTSDNEYILQASNKEEYEEWIREIQDGIMQALDSYQLERRSRTFARGPSVKSEDYIETTKICENVVERLRIVDGNKFCADCDCPQPGWASANIGVVICIECSGIHRGLGVQISKIKSLSLDKWDPILVEFMECNGNTKMNQILEANLTVPKITRLSSKNERLDYIVAKYVTKSFCVDEPIKFDTKNKEKIIGDSTDGKPIQVGNNEEHEKPIQVGNNEELVLSDSTDEDVKGTPPFNVDSKEELFSDSTDEDVRDIFDNSVTCLVKGCENGSHIHPPSLT